VNRVKTRIVSNEEIEQARRWFVVDADGIALGRLATRVATVLRGKHKPIYSQHQDVGDFVVVVNAEKVLLTGKKSSQKVYRHHSGYPGGMKVRSLKEVMDKYPERIVEAAVRGMLPHNRLGRQMYRKLKVYAGPEHPHQAQSPEPMDI
jgi:large subunit ribosomal protein L13